MDTDSTGDVVQPEGQGDPASGAAPWEQYLQRIPEQVRGEVEPVFRDWDGQVTKRFQEASEYRKQWEPYEQAGVHEVPPDELQGWLRFRQAAMEQPEAIQQWYDQYAQQHGLSPQQQQELDQQQPAFVDPDVEQLLEQKLGPLAKQFEELRAWQQQQEETARQQAASEFIENQIAGLQEKHGDQFNRQLVEKFVANHMDDPQHAVERAFADAQQFVASIEKQMLERKQNQPKPAEAGGGTNAAVDQPRSLAEAHKLALAQLRGENAA